WLARCCNQSSISCASTSSPLLSPSGFLRHCVIRVRLFIDNRLDHFADVRSQEPIDRDTDKLRCVQDRASLHNRIDSLFLIWPEPDVYDSLGHWFLPIRFGVAVLGCKLNVIRKLPPVTSFLINS